MPQVDKVTFYHVASWTAFIYISGYVFCSVAAFYALFSSVKLIGKLTLLKYNRARTRQSLIFTITNFPRISL